VSRSCVGALLSGLTAGAGALPDNGMKAVAIDRFGGPDVLTVREVEVPEPEADQILVRVIASGTNSVDAKVRAAGQWAQIELPAILGYEAAGTVERVGPCVRDFAVGDEVFYTPELFGNRYGTYAEYSVVPAAIVARKPAALSDAEAAAVPLAGGTAWEAIVRRLAVRPGENVLIHGGAGGVGSFAVQYAKVSGALVLATAGPANQDRLLELGVDVALNYESDDIVESALETTGGAGVDAVFDTVGGDVLERSQGAARAFGRLASILPVRGDFTYAYLHNQTIHGVFLTRERRRLEEMTPLFERGQVRVAIERILPLDQAAEAHRRLDSGHGWGKVVLQVADRA
jgi:NADPH2:quinone reductase